MVEPDPVGVAAAARRELLRRELAVVAASLPANLEPVVQGLLERFGEALVDVVEELLGEVAGSLDETMAVGQVPGLAVAAMRRLGGLGERVLGVRPGPAVGVGEWLAPLLEVVADSTDAELGDIRPRVFIDAPRRVAAAFAAHVPANWDAAAVLDVVALITDVGLPLVDVPPIQVVDALVAAHRAGGDVLAVLVAHRDEVLAGIDSVVIVGEAAGHGAPARYLAEAVASLRDGRARAALTTAAVACDVVAGELTGWPRTDRLVDDLHVADAPNMPLPELRRRLVLHGATRIDATWFPNSGEPQPAALSRHLAVHHLLDDDARLERDALWAILLLANLLLAKLVTVASSPPGDGTT